MSLRTWMWIALALSALGWWYSSMSPRASLQAHAPAAAIPGAGIDCPPPPRASPGSEPVQSAVPGTLPPFRLATAELRPLAGFSLDARVLSREDYALGREATLSPTDLALGWGRMREDTVLSRLDISQSGRWYKYRWQGEPPLPPTEIARSSANMHMIPADAVAAAALSRVREGERVRIEGWLVEAVAPDGWRWRSSTTRDDSGNGACELIYVCSITSE
jgi:hypothetical protein